MAKENIRITLMTLKRGSETSINGFNIKKQGNLWVVSKGDFFHRSFNEEQIGKLVDKLSVSVEEPTVVEGRLKARKAARLARKLEAKAAHEKDVAQKIAIKETKVREKELAKQAKLEEPTKRNGLVLEGFNLIVQAVAYFSWFGYFFTDIVDRYLGVYGLWFLIGIASIALLIHVLYVRQLGKRHRILNMLVGFIDLVVVVSALSLLYGPLSHTEVLVDQIVPSLEIAFSKIESISLVSFMFFKWVTTIIIHKK